MRYVALLRGINVGGNSIIKMTDLKAVAEGCRFENVRTFIQSGNIIFDSDVTDASRLASRLEEALLKKFEISSTAVILTIDQLKKAVDEVPSEWNTRDDMRCYMAFVREPVTAQEVAAEAKPREGTDFLKVGAGVLYMSTLLSGITKTGFTKLVGTKVYKDITMRNFTTVRKLLAAMQQQAAR
jgi:uncharacterized protein (DUF1697 family)